MNTNVRTISKSRKILLVLCLLLLPVLLNAQANKVMVRKDAGGFKITVDGQDFFLFGINWDHKPVGTTYSYNFFEQKPKYIKHVIDTEMNLLKEMGVNCIRVWATPPPRYIKYIYKKFGIMTMLGDTMGAYGTLVDGKWHAKTDYSDPRTREIIKSRMLDMVREYKDTPGLLIWAIGNENNYGLEWKSTEIENLPVGERNKAKAKYLYSLAGEIAAEIKKIDPNHPVTFCNGDLQYIDLINEQAPDLDIMMANVYRGKSSGDLFQKVQDKLDLPFAYSEFGCDAYNSRTDREDSLSQAEYELAQWKEIYQQSHGKGNVGNAVGGFLFGWTDGWWKTGQTYNLDVHDTTASWGNNAYTYDSVPGGNNMSEEWWGIAALGPEDDKGAPRPLLRTAYHVLKEAFKLHPYGTAGVTDKDGNAQSAQPTTLAMIDEHFDAIKPITLDPLYGIDRLDAAIKGGGKKFTVGLELKAEMSSYAHSLDIREEGSSAFDFDHTESAEIKFGFEPNDKLKSSLAVNIVGNAADNKIMPHRYENRLGRLYLINDDGSTNSYMNVGNNRIEIHSFDFNWETPIGLVTGLYHSGHHHWADDGDFFGLYRECWEMFEADKWGQKTSIGMIFDGKNKLDGLDFAIGPALYYGANPKAYFKYGRQIGKFSFTAIHAEEFAQGEGTTFDEAERKARKTSLYTSLDIGEKVKVELGGLFAAPSRIGELYYELEESDVPTPYYSLHSNEQTGVISTRYYDSYTNRIRVKDTFAAKLNVGFKIGKVDSYVLGHYSGLVAAGGSDQRNWDGNGIRDGNEGNKIEVIAGSKFGFSSLRIFPIFQWRMPLVAPITYPTEMNMVDGILIKPIPASYSSRDPFAGPRGLIAGEIGLLWDPTPGTWYYNWDNAWKEDAKFAGDLKFTIIKYTTGSAVNTFKLESGENVPFGKGLPEVLVWNAAAKLIFNPVKDLRISGSINGGTKQSAGESTMIFTNIGVGAGMTFRNFGLSLDAKINDWGPYDWQWKFNGAIPLQTTLDVNYSIANPGMLEGNSKIGLRVYFNLLDNDSPGFNTFLAESEDEKQSEVELNLYYNLNF